MDPTPVARAFRPGIFSPAAAPKVPSPQRSALRAVVGPKGPPYGFFGLIAFIFFLVAFPVNGYTQPLKLLFFYPGGQGDQASAQPLLDAFADSLKRNSGGTLDAKITYISDSAQGRAFVKTEKPQGGILSLDTFLKYGPQWGAKEIAKTLQLPSGDGTDRYFILGKKGAALPTSGEITLVSPREVDPGFVTEKLFPQLKGVKLTIKASQNTVGTLRQIGSGTGEGFVLLDQFEHANILRLKAAWVANLDTLSQSEKVSSAPFVVFSPPPDLASKLERALLQMSRDPASKDTLGQLRLKGFQSAGSTN